MTPDRRLNRRRFLAATSAASALTAAPASAADAPASEIAGTPGIIDCQSHLFLPEVIDLMRRRTSDPMVHERDGTTFLQMGDWHRKVPPAYTRVEDKLAAMDAQGITLTLLSNNDPGPEWFGDDGPAVARLIHDALAAVVARHPTRFRGL
ncbi:MAG: hypothetical protein ACKPAH_13645, partial [Verrucomicrobiota bacterium]